MIAWHTFCEHPLLSPSFEPHLEAELLSPTLPLFLLGTSSFNFGSGVCWEDTVLPGKLREYKAWRYVGTGLLGDTATSLCIRLLDLEEISFWGLVQLWRLLLLLSLKAQPATLDHGFTPQSFSSRTNFSKTPLLSPAQAPDLTWRIPSVQQLWQACLNHKLLSKSKRI